MKQISPKQRFLRYARQFADNRLLARLITKDMFDVLDFCCRTGAEPDTRLLVESFPNATSDLFLNAQMLGFDPWSHEAVTFFWRFAKKHCDMSDGTVTLGRIAEVTRPDIVMVYQNLKVSRSVNLFHLDLVQGDRVWLNGKFVIEVDDPLLDVKRTPETIARTELH